MLARYDVLWQSHRAKRDFQGGITLFISRSALHLDQVSQDMLARSNRIQMGGFLRRRRFPRKL
uniref:Uncharacterized protein n=1 Tax=Candidatus Kentrum sp. UNK TaxID=2126344 RepID=A0A451B3L1_9GAMM|nr:MAG: hypothetical protein BECKUNK1418G_GA0071005_11535 [Candidatus Kentron sp. UNK]VFK72865.1 MAG: hypothetical protein BECKUNK1418H_GA0071006_11455 [Candidatus Kentron sp. UNK]